MKNAQAPSAKHCIFCDGSGIIKQKVNRNDISREPRFQALAPERDAAISPRDLYAIRLAMTLSELGE